MNNSATIEVSPIVCLGRLYQYKYCGEHPTVPNVGQDDSSPQLCCCWSFVVLLLDATYSGAERRINLTNATY